VGLAAGAAFAGDFVLRVALLTAALGLAGWWWGSARLDALDASALVPHVGEAEQALVEVTGPARRSSFAMRVPGKALRFGSLPVHEPVLLEQRQPVEARARDGHLEMVAAPGAVLDAQLRRVGKRVAEQRFEAFGGHMRRVAAR
jgi:hypothetical protein